ncbi:hypothetical protein CANCADRAFT_17097, partial [Tortispora caseinolytica NRRL Y-17796]
PPCGSTNYICRESRLSHPKFGRLTVREYPATKDDFAAVNYPTALIIQPLASLHVAEDPIPLLDFGPAGPPRCNRCRAYVNPAMRFAPDRSRIICNLCGYAFEFPIQYADAIASSHAYQADIAARPEFNRGTVEFAVQGDYCKVTPAPIRIMFLIDVSEDAIKRGISELAVAAIRRALFESDVHVPGATVAIVAFNRSLHFFDLSPGAEDIHQMVMSDIKDPFCPLEGGLFADPQESRTEIESLLSRLVMLFEDYKLPEPAYGSALTAAKNILAKTGGKIYAFLGALPSFGLGPLFARDANATKAAGDQEHIYLNESGNFYHKLGQEFAESGIGLDLFALSTGRFDLAAASTPVQLSGGALYYYPTFVPNRDGMRVIEDVVHQYSLETGFMGELKVRCSNGVQVEKYLGPFYHAYESADPLFGVITSSTSLAVVLEHDGKIDHRLGAHFQSALLYTTADGQRRARVHNFYVPAADNAIAVQRSADPDAIVNFFAKQAAEYLKSKNTDVIRAGIEEKLVTILAGYRSRSSSSSLPTTLVIPDGFVPALPYSLGLIKTKALTSRAIISDARVASKLHLSSMGIDDLALYLYPFVFNITDFAPEDALYDPQTGVFSLPPCVPASRQSVKPGCVLLVYNGVLPLLYIDDAATKPLLRDLFGPEYHKVSDLSPELNALPELDTHISLQARNLLGYLAQLEGVKNLYFVICRKGIDGSMLEFQADMIED